MTQKLKFRLIKPEGIEHESYASMVVIPGSEGELGVMYGHLPMIVQLKIGEIRVYNDDKIDQLFIDSGIAKITNETVDIISI